MTWLSLRRGGAWAVAQKQLDKSSEDETAENVSNQNKIVEEDHISAMLSIILG